MCSQTVAADHWGLERQDIWRSADHLLYMKICCLPETTPLKGKFQTNLIHCVMSSAAPVWVERDTGSLCSIPSGSALRISAYQNLLLSIHYSLDSHCGVWPKTIYGHEATKSFGQNPPKRGFGNIHTRKIHCRNFCSIPFLWLGLFLQAQRFLQVHVRVAEISALNLQRVKFSTTFLVTLLRAASCIHRFKLQVLCSVNIFGNPVAS